MSEQQQIKQATWNNTSGKLQLFPVFIPFNILTKDWPKFFKKSFEKYTVLYYVQNTGEQVQGLTQRRRDGTWCPLRPEAGLPRPLLLATCSTSHQDL